MGVLGVFLSPNSSPKGRNIGLCNEKLRAMSGEEVEGMEQDALAARVRQVRSSGGGGGGRDRMERSSSSYVLDDSLTPCAGVHILQDQPEAQG